jgi:hypothetical protein
MESLAVAGISRQLLCYRSDPNGSKSHPLDIVQLMRMLDQLLQRHVEYNTYMIDDALPAATAIDLTFFSYVCTLITEKGVYEHDHRCCKRQS